MADDDNIPETPKSQVGKPAAYDRGCQGAEQGAPVALRGKYREAFLQQVEASVVAARFPGTQEPFFRELMRRGTQRSLTDEHVFNFQDAVLRDGHITGAIIAAQSGVSQGKAYSQLAPEHLVELMEMLALCRAIYHLQSSKQIIDSDTISRQSHAGVEDVKNELLYHPEVQARLTVGDSRIDWKQVADSIEQNLLGQYQKQAAEIAGQGSARGL